MYIFSHVLVFLLVLILISITIERLNRSSRLEMIKLKRENLIELRVQETQFRNHKDREVIGNRRYLGLDRKYRKVLRYLVI